MIFIKDNDDIIIDGSGGEGKYFLQWRIVNSGATAIDTIAISDTVKLKTPWTTYKIAWGQSQFPNGMTQEDTVFISPPANPVSFPFPGNVTQSQDSVVTAWCDSVSIVSGDISNPASEADFSNNVTCNNVLVTYWKTGIEEVIGNVLMLYPNPTSGRLTLRWDFAETIAEINILDVTGRQVHHQLANFDTKGAYKVELNVSFLPSGMYVVLARSGSGIALEKFYLRN